MKDATHFIEVIKTDNGSVVNLKLLSIVYLKDELEFSKYWELTTIAIWKIRMK